MGTLKRDKKEGIRRLFKVILMSSAMTILAISFQNCSEFVPHQELIQAQANFESQTALDKETTQSLNAKTIGYWKKPENASFINPTSGGIVSDSVAFAAVLSPGATGTVLSIHAGSANSEACAVIAQAGQIRLYHLTDANNYATLSAPMPSGSFVVSGRCGVKVEDLHFQVNGVAIKAAATKVGGGLLDFAYVLRNMTYTSVVNEAIVFEDTLSDFEMNLLARQIAGNHGLPVSADYTLNTEIPNAISVDPNFAPMLAVYNSKCVSCHTAYTSAANFISAGWVNKGDPANSKMFWRLQGAGVPSKDGKAQNMPMGNSINASDVALIRTWIQNMQ